MCPQLGWHEQGLKNRIGSVTPEEPSLLLTIGAKTPALEVSERVQALERLQVDTSVVVGAVEESRWDHVNALEQEVWISYNHTFSCHQAVRYLGFVDSLFKFCVNATGYHTATGSGTSIAGSSCSGRVQLITKRHVSQRWWHEQQLSSIGLRRQVLRSRGFSRSPCLSQSRSGPRVRIRVADVEKLQFLSEFGESGGFVASDKGAVFLDNHDTQRGEAQITYRHDDFCQLASLLGAFSCPRYGYSSVCLPPTPTPPIIVWKE